MNEPRMHSVGHDITCIDADYIAWGMASFYLLETAAGCAVIETGTNSSVANLEHALRERGRSVSDVRYIMPTHVHLDHAGGAAAMMRLCPEASLVVHPRGARHMVDPARLVEASIAVYGESMFRTLYGEILPIAQERVIEAVDGQVLELGERRLLIRHTEGHARHHYCIWDETSSGWFSGDMFGVCYPWFRFETRDFILPSTTPTQFDPQAYHESLALLDSYAPTRMYVTHSGALDYSPAARDLLRGQIDDYCEIAQRSAREGVQLDEALAHYHHAQLVRFAPEASTEKFAGWLAADVGLNAAGLAHWLNTGQR